VAAGLDEGMAVAILPESTSQSLRELPAERDTAPELSLTGRFEG